MRRGRVSIFSCRVMRARHVVIDNHCARSAGDCSVIVRVCAVSSSREVDIAFGVLVNSPQCAVSPTRVVVMSERGSVSRVLLTVTPSRSAVSRGRGMVPGLHFAVFAGIDGLGRTV